MVPSSELSCQFHILLCHVLWHSLQVMSGCAVNQQKHVRSPSEASASFMNNIFGYLGWSVVYKDGLSSAQRKKVRLPNMAFIIE